MEPLLAAIEALSERIYEHNQQICEDRRGKLSTSGAAGPGEESGNADRTDLPADAGGFASLPQEPRRGIATKTAELGAERTAAAQSATKAILICELCWCRVTKFSVRLERTAICGDGGLKLAESGEKKEKKRAVIATERKLAVLLDRLWVSGEAYEPLRNSLQVSMPAAA